MTPPNKYKPISLLLLLSIAASKICYGSEKNSPFYSQISSYIRFSEIISGKTKVHYTPTSDIVNKLSNQIALLATPKNPIDTNQPASKLYFGICLERNYPQDAKTWIEKGLISQDNVDIPRILFAAKPIEETLIGVSAFRNKNGLTISSIGLSTTLISTTEHGKLAAEIGKTSITGIQDLEFKTTSVDIIYETTIKKTTYYAGVGKISGTAYYSNDGQKLSAAPELQRLRIGLNYHTGDIGFGLGAQHTSSGTSINLNSYIYW